jgi:hypothetical protein
LRLCVWYRLREFDIESSPSRHKRIDNELTRTTRADIECTSRSHSRDKVIRFPLWVPRGRMHNGHLRGKLRPEEMHVIVEFVADFIGRIAIYGKAVYIELRLRWGILLIHRSRAGLLLRSTGRV